MVKLLVSKYLDSLLCFVLGATVLMETVDNGLRNGSGGKSIGAMELLKTANGQHNANPHEHKRRNSSTA